MDLNWLRDFECLARTLNFTRAAEDRNITQSAFSRRIKALESWVGAPLINRAGEMSFLHYVELGRPFEVSLIEHDAAAQRFELLVRQRERDCARIAMTYAIAEPVI